MLNRRLLLAAAALAGLCAALPPTPAAAQAVDPAQATAFVQRTGGELISVIDQPGSITQKMPRLQQIIDSAVDVNGVARFCLGRFWRTATPQQQQEYLQLFRTVLVKNITGRLGEYQGVHFTVDRAAVREDGTQVTTTITRPNAGPTTVVWVISNETGSPKVVDVIAEGTSLRLTQRSDYASYLARNNNNLQMLINALRQQAAAQTG